MSNARSAHGLDWRFEWARYVARTYPRSATVIAVAAALAMRASNRDGSVYLSSETLAAEIGKRLDHVKKARAVLVRGGFQLATGEIRQGCKVWWLTAPAISLTDTAGVESEKALHAARTRRKRSGDPEQGDQFQGAGGPVLGDGGTSSRSPYRLDVPASVPASRYTPSPKLDDDTAPNHPGSGARLGRPLPPAGHPGQSLADAPGRASARAQPRADNTVSPPAAGATLGREMPALPVWSRAGARITTERELFGSPEVFWPLDGPDGEPDQLQCWRARPEIPHDELVSISAHFRAGGPWEAAA